MASDISHWTQNDTWPPLRLRAADENGALDLTLAEELIFIAKQGATTISGTAIAMAEDGDGFNATYTWKANDLAISGTYSCELEITWDSGTTPPKVETIGSDDSDIPQLVVRPELG